MVGVKSEIVELGIGCGFDEADEACVLNFVGTEIENSESGELFRLSNHLSTRLGDQVTREVKLGDMSQSTRAEEEIDALVPNVISR